MKYKTTLYLLAFLAIVANPLRAQVVSNVNWELEGDERIVITYDLGKKDNYIYFDVSVRVKIDNHTVTPKALTGDVGNYIKVGTGKKITWNMFEDITELNGELSVEVLAVNPVPNGTVSAVAPRDTTTQPVKMNLPQGKKIPYWVGLGGIAATGVAMMMGGLKTKSEGSDLYDIYKVNRYEDADIYEELGSTRDQVYDEANKKNKSGTVMTIAGGAILATAGIIIVNRIIQTKKLSQRGLSFSPMLRFNPGAMYGTITPTAGVTLRYRLR
jgi:hypothetical protein